MNLGHLKNKNLFGSDMLLPDFLRDDDICSIIKNEVIPLINLEELEPMYKEGGRPPISPIILLVVTLLQYIECLTDRTASFNLRYRLDWKIALGLELEDEGIHFSTLHVFRNRLIEHDKASFLFDRILEHLVAKGLIQKSEKQRIDSTHVVGNVRELSRLELISETLRLFCKNANSFSSQMDEFLLSQLAKFSEKMSSYKMSKEDRKSEIQNMGKVMKAFITWAESSDRKKISLSDSFKTLKIVYEQNFDDNSDDTLPELIKVSTGKGHICSPHETEARFANKGGKSWIGYKAQIAETVTDKENKSETNFITYAEVNEATDYDGNIVEDYITSQESIKTVPEEVYADTHYNNENNIKNLLSKDIDLKGPVMPAPPENRTQEKNRGFKINPSKEKVTCPAGDESIRFSYKSQGHVSATFSKDSCQKCFRKNICKPEPRGKVILIRGESELLAGRREQMKTNEYKVDMYHRNGIEGTISGLVRGQEMRRSKYRGIDKTRLQIKFSATAANIKRLISHYEWKKQA